MAGWVIYGGSRRNPLIPSKPKESHSFWGVPNWRNMKKESSISERNEKDSWRIPFGGVSDWRNGKRNEQPSDPPSERTNGSEHKRGAAAPWFNGAAVLPVNKCGSSWLLCVSCLCSDENRWIMGRRKKACQNFYILGLRGASVLWFKMGRETSPY